MKRIISTIIAVVMVLSLVGCGNTQKANWSEHLEAGQKFLLDGNYEQAIIEFNKVIEIEPRNVDAYLGLAEVYVAKGDYEKAIEILEKGYAETESSEIQRRINELKGIAAPQTELPVTTVIEATTLPEPDPIAEDFAWTLEDGVLTVSGHGRMPDYDFRDHAPWDDRREEIEQVLIEDGITSIGELSFYWCSGITSITIPEGITSIGDSAFEGCTSLTSITILEGITSIGDRAFEDCTSLTSITIPNGITSIGEHAFNSCESLTSITIPDGITSIGELAFEGCTSLTNITIPDSVTSIGDTAFWGCKSLASITIPDSVISIGNGAFSGCDNLISITIPDSVTSIGINPFTECRNLAEINVNINNSEYCSVDGVLFTKDMTELISYPEGKQNSHYSIPEGVTTIRESAFCDRHNTVYYLTSLTSITIPDSVTSIGINPFTECRNLAEINVNINNSEYCSIDGVLFTKDMTELIAYPREKQSSHYNIPEGVTNIGEEAFDTCGNLFSITIPDSVTSIGDSAFSYCYSLTSIEIPNSVISIGGFAFSLCKRLTSITIPESVTSIGYNIFPYCDRLKDIYCEAESKPAGWDNDWLEYCSATVHWGSRG